MAGALAYEIDYWSQRTGKIIGAGDVEPQTWAMVEIGRMFSAREYVAAREALHAHTRRIARWWADGFDLLLTPTLAEPPPLLGEFTAPPGDPFARMPRQTPFVTFTAPFNITGQPAISLPLHRNAAGLPIGLQLVAAYGPRRSAHPCGGAARARMPLGLRNRSLKGPQFTKVNHRNAEQRLPATLARWRRHTGGLWFRHVARRARHTRGSRLILRKLRSVAD